jgi:hypothetical protein
VDEPDRPESGEASDVVEARRTPYELVFSADDFEARVFPRIREEARLLGAEAGLQEAFGFLSTAGEAIRMVVPPDAPAEALEQYGALFFHAFNFWRFGKRLYLLDKSVARYLVEGSPRLHGWLFDLPQPGLYVQLPANLFWGSISPESTPEPLDGVFVTCGEGVDALGRSFRRLELLAILGIRRDRAGFSVIALDTEIAPGALPDWVDEPAREDGPDYRSDLPGGEMAGLYSVLTSDELLKLVLRALWYLDSCPAALTLEAEPERRAADRPGSPPRPRLPYYRVALDDTGAEGAGG